ncbi:MAG: NAD(P)/FAD-dependent oxidoreductase [Thermoanaerobaculia bacterium]
MSSGPAPHIVILGAGFGGLYAGRALRRAPVRVTVVDRRNHHLFQPMLYQVSTAALSPGDIAYPVRSVLRRQQNARVLLATAKAIDTQRREVVLEDGTLPYDYLIVAAGARHAYFGHEEWEKRAPGLKSLEDALEIRRRILLGFERAEGAADERARQLLLTFVIVGGGPTGVEMAGAIAEIARHVLAHDFRSIDPREARIVLLEAGPRILPSFSEKLSRKAAASLTRLNVEVRTGTPVTGIEPEAVLLGDERLPAKTVIWAAGVAASPLGRTLGGPLDRPGRVVVNPDLSVPGQPRIFVIGDMAAFRGADGELLPGVSPVAIQQGRHAAANVLRAIADEPLCPFRYVNKGTMAVIGRAAAVAEFPGGFGIWGFPAWLAWCFVHIFFLIGFRNRVVVMFEWAWAYFTWQRGARLITGRTDEAP